MANARRAAWLSLAGIALATPAGDPFADMRNRARALMCWPSQGEVASIAASAQSLAAKLNSSCYWDDVDYEDPTDRADWSTLTHLDRTVTMLEALTVPDSPTFQDPALTKDAHCALAVWLNHGFTNTKCVCVLCARSVRTHIMFRSRTRCT